KLERRYVSVRSRIRAQTAHISLQISINVKEQEAKTNQKRHSYYGVSGCLTSYVFFASLRRLSLAPFRVPLRCVPLR
ncbi:hypothetical protein, partial [Rhodobacter aestuarii]|uniref:hypothetical protein n=1 Tax=Rhodobacter aestuarii TaxID=453582 RepID=UPI001C37746D